MRMKPERRCALIEYTLRKSAEEAAIKGARLKLWWAKSQQAADNADGDFSGDSEIVCVTSLLAPEEISSPEAGVKPPYTIWHTWGAYFNQDS